jgi:hypothetical protein
VNLEKELPRLLPLAIAWAESQAQLVASEGTKLPGELIEIARRVGVQQPDRVRTMLVDRLPFPEEPILRQAAIEAGMLGPEMVGLTLGYGIFIVHGHDDVRLISHECRHVYQYESLGSIEQFLPAYLQQILEYGYRNAPLEIDARTHEITII